MHLTIKQRCWSAIFMLAIFLNLTIGCNYYKVKTRYQGDDDFSEKLNKSLNQENLVLFVKGSQSFLAKRIDFDQQSITAELDSIPAELEWMHRELELSATNRFSVKKQGAIVHEVRIYPDQDQPLESGTITVPVNSIKRIDIYDFDTAKTILSVTAFTVGVLGLLFLIVALTKSSCPYIYSYNGNHLTFEGESYGGAIFKPLERRDFLPLRNLDTIGSIKRVRIANQLKERQYLNQVQLIELKTPSGVSALIDKYGNAHSYQDPAAPIRALSDHTDFGQQLATPKDGSFLFDTGDTGNSHIDLEFPNLPQEAKLIVNAKGSLWLDYLYGEFSKLFGDYYPKFITLQHNRSEKDMVRWIQNQDLLLTVYEQTISGWELIDRFDMVGPLGEGRDMIMSLPANADAGTTRVIRLETGFMFWELYYAALDYSDNQIIGQNVIMPLKAEDHSGIDRKPQLTKDDAKYVEQQAIGNYVTIDFETDPPDVHGVPHYFLAVKGYYEHIRDFQGAPEWHKLALFKYPGHFTRFSRQALQNLQVDLYAVNSEAY